MAHRRPVDDMEAFHKVLRNSRRILALCGAGLSAASGLPTFRGAGGFWRNYDATTLATPEAFRKDPGLVWLFYGYRRHMALRARPNAGHYALAALARKTAARGAGGEGGNVDFLCLTQNVDGLSQRAGHPPEKLRTLHGSLFDIKCSNAACGYVERDNFEDPLFPAIALASEDPPPAEQGQAGAAAPLPALLDPERELARIPVSEIPRCPRCQRGLRRPGVVWFGEPLDGQMMADVEGWIYRANVDLVLVVGTSAVVHPAASYVNMAAGPGTSVAVVNIEAHDPETLDGLAQQDFAFAGDAAELLPRMLEPLIGKMRDDGTFEE
ncbi:hypothetical protein VTK73DRAFT_5476 [Phialemonium thermophilum]|uniref:Deacetylase sirtuin-type domain-containing protein n=1 Tax=Phialemonium thermophilum TaxID=223376 RepID=A0ABR3WNM1_9PEZI